MKSVIVVFQSTLAGVNTKPAPRRAAIGLRVGRVGGGIGRVALVAAVTVVGRGTDEAEVRRPRDPRHAAGKAAIADRLDLAVPVALDAAVVDRAGDAVIPAMARRNLAATAGSTAGAAVGRVQRQDRPRSS